MSESKITAADIDDAGWWLVIHGLNSDPMANPYDDGGYVKNMVREAVRRCAINTKKPPVISGILYSFPPIKHFSLPASQKDLDFMQTRNEMHCVMYGHPKIVDGDGNKLERCPKCNGVIFEHLPAYGENPLNIKSEENIHG